MRLTRTIDRATVLAAVIACALGLLGAAQVAAAPGASGAVGGTWQTVEQPPLAGQRITALLADGPAGVWVGTEERGVAIWDRGSWRTLTSADGLPDDRVVALFTDRQGRHWVSTGTGLGYLPSSGGPVHRVPLEGLPSLPVLAIGEAQDGSLLLGMPSGMGVWRAGGTLQLIPELAGKRVVAIQTDRTGVTWVGSSGGLWHSAGLGWQREQQVTGPVHAFAAEPDGRLFMAGDAGAWELQAGSWTLLPTCEPAPFTSASVHDGTLWLAGRAGLTAGQGNLWQSYDPRLLQGPTVTALAWSGDGRLWVGASVGLLIHQPDAAAPTVRITSVNGLPPSGGPLALDVDHIERITLAADDAGTPSTALRLFVRLDGLDAAPRLVTSAEAADPHGISIYAGHRLGAGAHTLRVWAQDDAFNRSTEAQVILVIPSLTHLPGGLTLRREAAAAGAAAVVLLLTAAAIIRFARLARRRQIAYAAHAATEQVRAAASRSGELYAAPVPLRGDQVQETLAVLPTQSVLLLGAEGMGKTETLRRIADSFAPRATAASRLVAAPLDLACVSDDAIFSSLGAAAARALFPLGAGARPRLNWTDGALAGYGEQAFSADLSVLLAWLQGQRTERLVLVFLVDNAGHIDRCMSWTREAFRRLLVASTAAPSPVRLVLAAEHTPHAAEGLADLLRTIVLPPLAGAAAVQLLREGARGLVDWDSEAARLVVEQAGGSPGVLIALGRAAALAALAGQHLVVSAAHVPAAETP